MKTNNPRVNERISASRVVLIDSTGVNRGEVAKYTALNSARDQGLDLVEVAPGIVPVCRVMDYGKMLYDKNKQQKHQTHSPVTKEIRIHYLTGDHDIEIKKKKMREFLADRHKVLFVMLVKGRERFAGAGAAKEKFLSIVKEFSPNAKLSDIQENGKGFSTLIHPS